VIILGIDPGFRVTGYAIARRTPTKASIFDYGYLPLAGTKPLPERATIFHDFFLDKITQHRVTHLVLETPFLGKNAQSFLKLGYLRGILYVLSHKHNIQLHEASPREIKQAVTGYGGASKEQVAMMMMQLFPQLKDIKKTVKQDVTDALAICMTGLWQFGTLGPSNPR
jgi:crossover junction endodeoxyribonuclease RuvC